MAQEQYLHLYHLNKQNFKYKVVFYFIFVFIILYNIIKMTFPLMKKVNDLCKPAYLYLAVSVVVILILIIQNVINGDKKELCVGTFSCNVTNVVIILVLKILYVLFWTVVLDALCKYGLKSLSWVLVVLPYVVSGIALFLLG